MANPICLSPLKFYDSLAKQSHRKSYAYNHIIPLITKTGWIPPFQFVIPEYLYKNGTFFIVYIKNIINGELIYNCLSTVGYIKDNMRISNIDGSRVFIHTGKNPITNIKEEGQYYLEIFSVNGEISTFTSVNNLKPDSSLEKFVSSTGHINRYFAVERGKEYIISVDAIGATDSHAVHMCYSENIPDTDVSITSYSKTYLSKGKISLIKIVSPIDGYFSFSIWSEISNGKCSILKETSIGNWAYYSEVFCFTNVTKDCLELEYWNETGNFAIKNGVIAFPPDFHFKLLLKGEIGKPEYSFEEESTKRLGYVYVESQVSKKTYKFNVVVPEYICDALRIVRLCDNKIIRCKDDEYEAISFEMEADWQTQGDLASVTCEFETDNVIANIGGFVPDKLGGDYNNNYNEDFDKE